ncbi:SF1B family DNA helicase RecD2 [Paenibacillus hunanensis]|uniref:ATP-dependent RecD2 DNA helicase n=1 Tax=Paenibacillus hunanensis TaxID=539262 RepID=A0ABU1IW87_9BACL|nr:ATP-dependent RecD-like DNA helicase [Paenibacillus hunanensis]MDR6243439.1 exodeoxyribonuclease V alpha subunit [Paenibacillus hunanensis]GGI97744.1 ATP-dependent RecD-like DNA helicase [Paenibacillus hunanensis]
MDTTTLTGHIDYFIHPQNGRLSEENHFGIAHFQLDNLSKEPVVVKGSLFGMGKNERITVNGAWETHPKYGQQFAVTHWERPLPISTEQVVAFLSSKFVKGCGKKRAELIAKHLGDKAIDRIMQEGTGCLLDIRGVGSKNAGKIANSIQQNFEIQQVMAALMPYGITAELITKAYSAWGTECVDMICRNPYRLTELGSLGFVKADEVASQIGIDMDSPYRLNAALHHTLNEMCYGNGHCYVMEQELIDRTMQLLHGVDGREIWTELQLMAAHEQVIWERDRVYPKSLYIYESKLAYKVSCMVQRPAQSAPNLDQLIREYQLQKKIVLAEKQREAIRMLFMQQLLIVTGNPGTGKTTTVQAMLELYQQKHTDAKIGLCAPAARAARRLGEITHRYSETLHLLLGFRPGEEPEYGESLPLPYDLVCIDEWSMADLQMAYYLFEAIGSRTKVILVGDSDQLASVGPGNVLRDLIAAGVPHIRLDEIFRRAKESQITMNAHRINGGKDIQIDDSKDDFYFIEQSSPEAIQRLMIRSVLRFLDIGYALDEIFILSPMKKGLIGTEELNVALQAAINPPAGDKVELKVQGMVYRQGDKILRLRRNDYSKKVLNGDIGTVKGTKSLLDEEGKETDEIGLLCDFYGHEVLLSQRELRDFGLGYAATIHKTIGCEAPIVIMPVSIEHRSMLIRENVYTGLTRAKQIAVMIGSRQALRYAIQNKNKSPRNTGLRERIGQHLTNRSASINHSGKERIN